MNQNDQASGESISVCAPSRRSALKKKTARSGPPPLTTSTIPRFAMKRDMIGKSLQQFKDVNIEVHYIQMAPLALCNFLAHDCLGKGAAKGDEGESTDKECVVGLDIGCDNSNLVITDGERIIWQR